MQFARVICLGAALASASREKLPDMEGKQEVLDAVDTVESLMKEHLPCAANASAISTNFLEQVRSLIHQEETSEMQEMSESEESEDLEGGRRRRRRRRRRNRSRASSRGANRHMNDFLYRTIRNIENTVDARIRQTHGRTQAAINEAVDELRASSSNALHHKKSADEADSEHFNCVRRERAMLADAENKEQQLKKSRSNVAEPCQVQEDTKHLRVPMNHNLDFRCDIAYHGNCNQQLYNYENHIRYMVQGVKSEVQEKKAIYTEAKHDCEAAKADIVKKQSASDSALQAWRDQQGQCRNRIGAREEGMCLFGSSMQRKCMIDLPAYNRLIELVDASGNQHSHHDRIQAWHSSHVTKCLLNHLMRGQQLTQREVHGCVQSVDYNGHVGQLDKQEEFVQSLQALEGGSCEDQQGITFGRGQAWEVPDKEDLTSADYAVEEFEPTLSLAGGTIPFEFCTGYCEVVRVGSSHHDNTKRATLPKADMHCSEDPFNPQHPHWRDQFSIKIEDRSATVRRLDYRGGWGQDLTLKCCNVPEQKAGGVSAKEAPWRIIEVGNSRSNTKSNVQLPIGDMRCSNVPQNPQRPEWRDRFAIQTEGDKLSVRRLDSNGGWGQHLQLKCH